MRAGRWQIPQPGCSVINYYTANNTFNAQGNKVKGAAGSGFQSYALNFYYARGLPAG